MCAPSTQHNPANWRLADATRLSRALIDAMLQLIESPHPGSIHIIGHRRAAKLNRVLQNLAQGQPQTLQFRSGQPSGLTARPNPRVKQTFVSVDVAYPGEQRLVQQCGLDGQLPPVKERREFL